MQLARTKEWRESRGFTQRELAAEAGISEVTVARLETGHSSTPSTARKIAAALGVSVADLLERPPVPLVEAPPETGPDSPQGSEDELIFMLTYGDEKPFDEAWTEAREELKQVRRFYDGVFTIRDNGESIEVRVKQGAGARITAGFERSRREELRRTNTLDGDRGRV